MPQPNTQPGVGLDALPESIRFSKLLTGNHLGRLANVHEAPVVSSSLEDEQPKNIVR